MRRYKTDLDKLKAKVPEPAIEEDLLTRDARAIHEFLTIRAEERGEEPPSSSVEDIKEYLQGQAAMSVEERVEDYRQTWGREPSHLDIESWRQEKEEAS